ncbi:MAG TPA: serine hydrolase domain-containing protein [Rectinemataceae bacterium]|nr:serine hydrolase domain-containing protein [Rectinemataceae bacterium]
MKILKRIAPFAVIVAAALLLLYLPDIGPERYTDLGTFFRVERSRQALSGIAVAVVAKGSVLYVDAFGHDGAGRTLGPNSQLFIGEGSETFTGLCAMALVRDGRLDLDAPVRRYLPWFGFAQGAGQDVSPRHLLTHTSGVSDGSFDDVHASAQDLTGAVRFLLDAVPLAPPGRQFNALATDYQALGLVMEKVSGERYADLLADLVFRPLGMRGSTARPEDLRRSTPQGFGSFFGMPLQRAQTVRVFGAPSAYVVSTASDLGAYLAYLAAPERQRRPPLPQAAVGRLFQPLVPDIPFGWGWYLQEAGGAGAALHDGSLDGFSSRLVLWPLERNGVALAATQNSLLQSMLSLPALASGARRIILEGQTERPFPLGRLYILLAVMAAVHLIVLSAQTGGALRWAKDVKGRADAVGAPGPIRFAVARSILGLALRVAVFSLAPAALGILIHRRLAWGTAFALEPGIAAWFASACFFGALRNVARLAWLRGARSVRRQR